MRSEAEEGTQVTLYKYKSTNTDAEGGGRRGGRADERREHRWRRAQCACRTAVEADAGALSRHGSLPFASSTNAQRVE